MPFLEQVLMMPRKASRQSRPASLRVPPLISRLVTWQRMSFSEPLVCSGISGLSSTLSNSALLARRRASKTVEGGEAGLAAEDAIEPRRQGRLARRGWMAAPSLETAVEQPDQAADAALRGALGVGERGVLGGIWSDLLLRRGWSLTAARKTPIVAGMLMSMSMILCNYVDARSLVVAIMALSFFGKGVGALGWAVVSDTVPREIAGLSGGLFNMFGNLSSITTPIVIGFIIQSTGSFDGALVFIGANALVAIFSYLVIVGEIKRFELRKPMEA